MEPSKEIKTLLKVMSALRTPITGCPWDIEQNFETIAPYTLEECYEVLDAIERDDMEDLCEELGDLLLQVVFHAQMAHEAGHFDFGDVVERISTKMIRRHPHVFGANAASTKALAKGQWEAIKAEEKAERLERRRQAGLDDKGNTKQSLLDDVPMPLPALIRAVKLQKKAGKVGFDWNDPKLVLAKMREELDEIEEALESGDQTAIEDEIGDMLFATANLARHMEIDPEFAARHANQKFTRRFQYIEKQAGDALSTMPLDEMEALWVEAKQDE
jgi:ATP diphosphatase